MDDGVHQRLLAEVERWLRKANLETTQFMLMPLAEAYARKAHWTGNEPPDWSYHCNQTLTLVV